MKYPKSEEFRNKWLKKKNGGIFSFNKKGGKPGAFCHSVHGNSLLYLKDHAHYQIGKNGSNNLEIISEGEANLLNHQYEHAKKIWPIETINLTRIHHNKDGSEKQNSTKRYAAIIYNAMQRYGNVLFAYECTICGEIHVGHSEFFLEFNGKNYYIR